MNILRAGAVAPDFCLPSTPNQKVCLHEFLGKNVVLIFYPADWSPVCTEQLGSVRDAMIRIKEHDVEVLGISVDNSWCHLAFQKDSKYGFQLLSDFEPKGEVSKKYGVYRPEDGTSARAAFLIGSDGRIVWSDLAPVGANPGVEGIIDALENMYPKSAAV